MAAFCIVSILLANYIFCIKEVAISVNHDYVETTCGV